MKIGLTGTMSIGKTTLIKELSKLPQFKNYKIATERSKYLRDLGIPLNTDSTIKGQTMFLAERTSELFQENLLTDRTIIDVMAFTRQSTSMSTQEKIAFEEYAKLIISEYDYIFYTSPEGVEIEDNGVREINPEYRDQIDLEIKSIIDLYRLKIQNLTIISGSTEQRIEKILKVISS